METIWTLDEARAAVAASDADTLPDVAEAGRHLGQACTRVLIATDVDIENHHGHGALGEVVPVEDLAEWLAESGSWATGAEVATDAARLAEAIRAGEDTWGPDGEMAAGVTVLWRDAARS